MNSSCIFNIIRRSLTCTTRPPATISRILLTNFNSREIHYVCKHKQITLDKVYTFKNSFIINPQSVLTNCIIVRYRSNPVSKRFENEIRSKLFHICGVAFFFLGMSFAAVPLYKKFCQAAGLGGQAVQGHDISKVETMKPVDRVLKIKFNADTGTSLQWKFRPLQSQVMVKPGETALAFYSAQNTTERPIIGISTYNILPFEAAKYFNKIQCFCFEEQRLNPHEQVDMPVFFYIDPEYAENPLLENCNEVILSYTFFEAKEGMTVPIPDFLKNKVVNV